MVPSIIHCFLFRDFNRIEELPDLIASFLKSKQQKYLPVLLNLEGKIRSFVVFLKKVPTVDADVIVLLANLIQTVRCQWPSFTT